MNCVLCRHLCELLCRGPLHNTKRNVPYSCLGVDVLCRGSHDTTHQRPQLVKYSMLSEIDTETAF